MKIPSKSFCPDYYWYETVNGLGPYQAALGAAEGLVRARNKNLLGDNQRLLLDVTYLLFIQYDK